MSPVSREVRSSVNFISCYVLLYTPFDFLLKVQNDAI